MKARRQAQGLADKWAPPHNPPCPCSCTQESHGSCYREHWNLETPCPPLRQEEMEGDKAGAEGPPRGVDPRKVNSLGKEAKTF